MKCGEVLDGGLLSCDPCDFKERPAHLINQMLMLSPTLTVTPPKTPPYPGPYCTLSFFTGGSWQDNNHWGCQPFQDNKCCKGVCLICVHAYTCSHEFASMDGEQWG